MKGDKSVASQRQRIILKFRYIKISGILILLISFLLAFLLVDQHVENKQFQSRTDISGSTCLKKTIVFSIPYATILLSIRSIQKSQLIPI